MKSETPLGVQTSEMIRSTNLRASGAILMKKRSGTGQTDNDTETATMRMIIQ